MPILLKMTYKDTRGKVLNEIGPKELYLPKVNSLNKVNSKVVFDALEDRLEDYNWTGHDDIRVEWEAFPVSIN